PSTFPPDKVESFGADVPMKRPGQPEEVASCFVFLAAEDSSYMAGQILHPNGGSGVNGELPGGRQHGADEAMLLGYMTSATFWFQSLQNWQSEFLSAGALVLLSIHCA